MKTQTLSTRRKFFWQAGAVLSAPLAVASANAAEKQTADSAQIRLTELENITAIRDLQQNFILHLNSQAIDKVQALFLNSQRAEVDKTISSLNASTSAGHDYIELAIDGKSAKSISHVSVQFAIPLSNCSLVDMARQQGDGVHRYKEEQIIENEYIKQDDVWKINQSSLQAV